MLTYILVLVDFHVIWLLVRKATKMRCVWVGVHKKENRTLQIIQLDKTTVIFLWIVSTYFISNKYYNV